MRGPGDRVLGDAGARSEEAGHEIESFRVGESSDDDAASVDLREAPGVWVYADTIFWAARHNSDYN